jgi:tetratricopeptide (TPR) repeat protein
MNGQAERLWARCHADGMRLFQAGRDAEARRELNRAVRHARAAGIADARLASTLFQLAAVAQADHRWAEAEQHYQRALAAEEAGLGADHPYVAMILRAYARMLARRGRITEAAELDRRAEAIWSGEAAGGRVGLVA